MAEGYQADSGLEEDGNFVKVPYPARRGFGMGATPGVASLSAGRFPDGADLDDNKNDFRVQQALSLALPAEAGATNVKVQSVAGLAEGAPIVIGRGPEAEVLEIVKLGSAGGTTLSAPVAPMSRELVVASAMGFVPGQEILVGEEEAIVAEAIVPRGWWMPREQQVNKLVLQKPLRKIHHASEPVSGTGVTLSAPLKAAHAAGAPAATGQPTPGAANQY
jgi:hypothetical protein